MSRDDAAPQDEPVGQAGLPLTLAQRAAAAALGMRGQWYRAWLDAAFTEDEIANWYPVTCPRSPYPEVAVRLAAYGWGPQDLSAAITRLRENWPHTSAHDARTGLAQAVLWGEVAEYHQAQAAAAKELRRRSLAAARAGGATLKALARVTGWTTQYIHQITRGTWPVPPEPPANPPPER